MKKFMRLVTLMLVLAMAVTVLSLPAAAVTDCTEVRSAEPRGPVIYCSCGGYCIAHSQKVIDGDSYWYGYCNSCGTELTSHV